MRFVGSLKDKLGSFIQRLLNDLETTLFEFRKLHAAVCVKVGVNGVKVLQEDCGQCRTDCRPEAWANTGNHTDGRFG